jgi:hypothetical protein
VSEPAGWKDVTSQHIHKFDARCTQAVFFGKQIIQTGKLDGSLQAPGYVCPASRMLERRTRGIHPNGCNFECFKRAVHCHKVTKPVIAEGGFAALDNFVYMQRATCGDTKYLNTARLNWSPYAGTRFLPPTIKHVEGSKHMIRLSCGDPMTLTSMETVRHEELLLGIEHHAKDCCVPAGAMSHNGYVTMAIGTDTGRNDAANQKHLRHSLENMRNTACYRKQLGVKPEAPPCNPSDPDCVDGYAPVRCESEFTMQILEQSNCGSSQHNQKVSDLLQFNSTHKLIVTKPHTDHPACKLWFSFVDFMIRSAVADLRSKLSTEKVKQCQSGEQRACKNLEKTQRGAA